MSGDLLRFLSGPSSYSPWWWVLAAALLVLVAGWIAGVVVWTLPPRQLSRLPGLRTAHARVIRDRFARSIRRTSRQQRSGELSTAAAAAVMSRTLRSFLALTTGERAQYVHIGPITAGRLAPAAPVLSALDDVRYNTASSVDLTRTAREAEELIRTWI